MSTANAKSRKRWKTGSVSVMSDEPKPWTILHRSKLPVSDNGKGPIHASTPAPGTATQEERKTNLKYAFFFLAVAILLLIARQLGKDVPATSSQSSSMYNVRLDLYLQQSSGKVVGAASQSKSTGSFVRFRLSNGGNYPVFYPAHPGTNVLAGHIVYRTTRWLGRRTIS